MARPVTHRLPLENVPPDASDGEDVPIDPTAIERRYRLERARRRARERRMQESALARVRFYVVLGVLFAVAVVLVLLTWDEVQRLFGL